MYLHIYTDSAQWCVYHKHNGTHAGHSRRHLLYACMLSCTVAGWQWFLVLFQRAQISRLFFFFLIRLQSNDRQSKPFLTEILIRQVGDGNRTEGNGHTVAADSLWWDVGPFFSALLSVCFLSQCFSKKTNPDICHSDLFHKAHWWIHILRKNKKHWMPQPPYQFVFNLRKIPVVRYCL